jgi:pimeloyl-ACP methyl ester carboxylesterase
VRTIIATQPGYLSYHLGETSLRQWQEGMDHFLECARTGADPYKGATSGVRTCRSKIDGQILFYVFRLPKDYSPDRKYPVDILLHSGAALIWVAGWIDGKPSSDPKRANKDERIWISPCGRGNNCYAAMGEVAVLEALRDLQKHYSVDADRVTIGGASMGGTGGFRLSTLHPDLFAAAHSLTGGENYAVPVNNGRFDAMLAVDNLCNTGMCIWDAPKEGHWKTNHQFSDWLRERAKKYPGSYPHLELTDPKGGHGIIERKLIAEGWDWIRSQKRNPYPKRVVYKTYCLRYDGAYWARIDTVVDPAQPSRIEAELRNDGRIQVVAENIDRFHLMLAKELVGSATEVEIIVNGGMPCKAAAGGPVSLARTASGWSVVGERYPKGLVKKHALSGPVQDAFMGEPVLMVYGTAESAAVEKSQKMVDDAVLSLFGPGDGGVTLHTPFERKADRDLDASDITDKHLVLFGTPKQNLILRKIADKLPAKFLDQGVEIAGKPYRDAGLVMVYPNPLNPERYVLILPEDYCGGRAWTFPDYLVVASVKDTKGRATQKVLAQGNFDARWQIAP